MAQRARRDRERLERSSRSLTPSRRQRAQIERAKAKSPPIQSDAMLEEFHGRPITNMLGTSSTTILPFTFETHVPPEYRGSCLQIREKSIIAQNVQMGQPEPCSSNFDTYILYWAITSFDLILWTQTLKTFICSRWTKSK